MMLLGDDMNIRETHTLLALNQCLCENKFGHFEPKQLVALHVASFFLNITSIL